MTYQKEIDAAWKLLEENDAERALAAASALESEFPESTEVQLLKAAAAFTVDDPYTSRRAARRVLERERSGGLTAEQLRESRFYLAQSCWRLWEFEDAEREVRRMLRDDPENADAWDLLGRILEQTGRPDEARSADERAAELDPEAFPMPVRLSEQELEDAVEEALSVLPDSFGEFVQEVPILIEDLPTREMALPVEKGELPLPPDLFGLFAGTSRMDRSFLNPLETPGTVFLFKTNLERYCADRDALTEEIAVTLWHELAHYLGFDEDDMPGLGLD